MHSRGIKRKLCGGGGGGAAAGYVADHREDRRRAPPPPPYGVQRRALLDMSLVKLQHCHTLAEPDLCRSVLIANTVRQIQGEMMTMMTMHNDVDHDGGSCQVVPDPFMVSCGPESPLPDSHVSCQNGNVSSQNGNVSSQSGNISCLNSNILCPNNSDMLCPNGNTSCRPRAADHNLATYDLCPEEEEESYCWGRAELKMMGHALLEEEEAESTRCILGQEEEELEDDVFLGKLEMRTGASAVPSAGGGGSSSPGGLEEFLSDVEASYYDLDTMAIGTATPTTTLTELDHIMEIIVGGS